MSNKDLKHVPEVEFKIEKKFDKEKNIAKDISLKLKLPYDNRMLINTWKDNNIFCTTLTLKQYSNLKKEIKKFDKILKNKQTLEEE